MNEVNPSRLWGRLTRLTMTFALLSSLSAGAWLAGFLVRPDPVTPSNIRYFYQEANRWWNPRNGMARRFDNSPDWQRLLDDPEWVAARIEESVARDVARQQWESRCTVQKPSAIAFWVSLVLFGFFYVYRRDPVLLDNTLASFPKMISHSIPYSIARWRVSAMDAHGSVIASEIHRTARQAMSAARRLAQAQDGVEIRQVQVVWDTSGYDSYMRFISSKGL